MTPRRLPPEILQYIFVLCLPTHPARKLQNTDAPVNLTQVCSAWYHIATTTSKLWSTIALLPSSSPSTFSQGTSHLRLCLSRAKRSSLHLYLHVAFLAHPPSYALLNGISHRISTLSFFYPESPDTGTNYPPYFPQDCFATPKLICLEVHIPPTFVILAQTDFERIRFVAQSSYSLRCFVFSYPYTHEFGPIQTKWSTLQDLRLTDPMPLALCSYILRNAPSLRRATFACIYSVDLTDNLYNTETLKAVLADISSIKPNVPFTHPMLESLLIAHGDHPSILETFFDTFTLPSLQNLLLHCWNVEVNNPWPQATFLSFLRRSRCSLKMLELYFEPLSPEQLIEVLESPAVNDTLIDLSVQNEDAPPIFNDLVVEELTLSPSRDRKLCPQLKMMGIHNCISSSFEKFAAMLDSRLDSNFQFSRPHFQDHAYLRYLETDDSPFTHQYIKPLVSRGLLTVVYDNGPEPKRAPLGNEEKRLLHKYISEGLVMWEYNPNTGEWGPNYDIEDCI